MIGRSTTVEGHDSSYKHRTWNRCNRIPHNRGAEMGQLVRAVAASRRATELFKTLDKVRVVMNPFDHRSTTARYAPSVLFHTEYGFLCLF